jgi:hypothetical protein
MGTEILLNSSVVEGIDHDVRHESQYPCDPDDFGRPPIEGLVLEFEPLESTPVPNALTITAGRAQNLRLSDYFARNHTSKTDPV